MVTATNFGAFNCSLARALALVGDPWSMLIMRDAHLGLTRFAEFQRSLGVARNILADRLGRLVAGGILARKGSSTRPVYILTAKGSDLLVPLLALTQWGDRWLAPDGPPVILQDRDGEPIPDVGLPDAGVLWTAGALHASPGPGADQKTRSAFSGRSHARRRDGSMARGTCHGHD